MSTEALNRIIKEAKALTPDERHELIDRLAREEQNSHKQLGRLSNRDEEISTDKATLREWLSKARNIRTQFPLTSDSVEIVRELREVRSRQ